ncbi:MAG TPA: glycyl-radical enzyme activating protein [Bacteroidales bacterium]|nr:glycyl-radical enzyme activating protein [Bacteroidales bacterium]
MLPAGLIFDIKRFSVNDGPGIRTTIFFKGCPLSCRWCHNPESKSGDPQEIEVIRRLHGREYCMKEIAGRTVSVEEVLQEIEKESVFHETSGGGVTFSGGEPLMQPEFLLRLLDECRKRGIHTCLDTCGYCEGVLFKEFITKTDLFLFDVKVLDGEKHIRYTGVDNSLILSNLFQLDAAGNNYIIRMPVIPGINDDHANIVAMKELLHRLKNPAKEMHLLPYHPLAKNKLRRLGMEDKMNPVPEIDESKLHNLALELEQTGYRVVIGG